MKTRWLIILAITLGFNLDVFCQIEFGIGTSFEGTKIIPIGHGSIGDFPVEFLTGFGTGVYFTAQNKLNKKLTLKSDIGIKYLTGPGQVRRLNSYGVEKVLRICLPIELLIQKDGIVGGYIGFENNFNYSVSESYIGYLIKPYSCSISIGFVYSGIKRTMMSFGYSIDALAFSRGAAKPWVFQLSSTPHFHFGTIGVRFYYYPQIKAAG